MHWIVAVLVILLAVGPVPASAQHSAAKESHVDRVMVPIQAFAAMQIEGPLTEALNQFKSRLRQEHPDLFQRHEKEVHQMLRGLVVTSIETFMAEIRLIFLDVLSEDELARFAGRIDGDAWRPSDFATLVKWPEISKRISAARQTHQQAVVLTLSQEIAPRMKELGFYPDPKN